MATKVNDSGAVTVKPVEIATSTFMLLGMTPMIQNRLPEKARMELLMPKGRKTWWRGVRSRESKRETVMSRANRLWTLRGPTMLRCIRRSSGTMRWKQPHRQ